MDKSFTDALIAVANFVGGIDTLIAHSFGAATALVAQRDLGASVNKQVLVNTFDRCYWLVEEFAKDIGASHSVVRAMREKMAAPYGGDIHWNCVPLTDMLAISKVPTLLIHDTTNGEITFRDCAMLMSIRPHVGLYVTHALAPHQALGASEVQKRVVVSFLRELRNVASVSIRATRFV
jgi:hypothetical protein